MKKLFLTILFTLVLSGGAFSQSMIDLKTYMEKNQNDKDFVYYTYYRCTAVYNYATRSTTDEELQEKLRQTSAAIMSFSMEALSKEMKLDAETAIQRVTDHVELIHKNYIHDGYEYHAKTGDYFEPYMKSDLILCNELFQPIMKDILK